MLCALAKARHFLSRLNALQTAHLECEERRRGNNGKTIGDRHRKIQSVQTGKCRHQYRQHNGQHDIQRNKEQDLTGKGKDDR